VVRACKAALVVDGISEQPLEDAVVVIQDENIGSGSGGRTDAVVVEDL
jgi:hypothetical protein